MALEISFLAIGNADCAVVVPESRAAVVVDIGDVVRAEQRLRDINVNIISVIYVTHDHDDHAPSLEALDGFVHRWRAEERSIRRIRIPMGMGASWMKRIKTLQERGDDHGAKRLKEALSRLLDRDRQGAPNILHSGSGDDPYMDGDLMIKVLHPSTLFLEAQFERPPNDNEASMVVRLSYGQFSTIFLGDLDGRGTAECLLLAKGDSATLRAHIVKIPHHGAWPRSARSAMDLAALLELIQPRLAVLSVGSTNAHGHVKPELFSCLTDLKVRSGLRFLCTEVTRTCLFSAADCRTMDRKGLPARQPCAGDIKVIADLSGNFQLVTSQVDHDAKVRSLPFAACDGRASGGT